MKNLIPSSGKEYPQTTDEYHGDIPQDFSTWDGLPDGEAPYELINAPFGFGQGVSLRSHKTQVGQVLYQMHYQ